VALGDVLVSLAGAGSGHGPLACDTLPSKRRVFRGARMDAMLTITGVAEIVLNVRDLPKMREFYKEVLGNLIPTAGSARLAL